MGNQTNERRVGMKEIIPLIKDLSIELKEIRLGQIETNKKVDFIHSKLFIKNGAPGLIQQFKENDEALAESIKELDEKKIIPLTKSVGKIKSKVNKIVIFFTAVPTTVAIIAGAVALINHFT